MKKIITIILSLSLVAKGATAMESSAAIALMPQQNACRNVLDLSGTWRFKADRQTVGETEQWQEGLKDARWIAVPGSWNEQIEGLRNYMGTVWYEKETYIPEVWKNERILLRVGSVCYAAKVWVNGELMGTHEGGHLPFAFDLTNQVRWGQKNRISIQVENRLLDDRVPGGQLKGGQMKNYPEANYDFFPYGGLHRAVTLYTVPKSGSLSDIMVTTELNGTITVRIEKTGQGSGGEVTIRDQEGRKTVTAFRFKGDDAQVKVKIDSPQLWSPEHPYLYETTVSLHNGNKTTDIYTCQTGIRTIAVKDGHLLLNGEEIRLRGFGKHEDFPIFGRGNALPVTIRDFELMKWTGANSLRTSHYPYDESVYDLADRLGFLIIDEIPAVGLVFYDGQEKVDRRRRQCDQYLREMIARDKNHPSVIMWCVANEPALEKKGQAAFTGAEKQGADEEHKAGADFLGGLMDMARQMDPTRPATFVSVMGGPSDWMAKCDVVCINRYFGWYTNIGDFPTALKYFGGEMDKLHQQYPDKPIVVTEFGADAIAGMHSGDGEMFSEEFQKQFVGAYLDVANQKGYVSGMMVWNFADFRTGQAIMRVGGMNLKGIFTQDRKPKMAAHLLHERWTKDKTKY